MSYNSTVITALNGRIAWAQPMSPTAIVLTSANGVGTSGRTFDAFHPMAIVENVESCMPISNADTAVVSITNTALNDYLTQLSDQAVLQVLSKVFDNNERANYRRNYDNTLSDTSATDYSSIISSKISLFDDAIGYQVAYNTLGMMLTTSRINNRERNASDKGQIRLEQQGIRDERGKLIVPGVAQYLLKAIEAINNVLFPEVSDKPRIRNASMYW